MGSRGNMDDFQFIVVASDDSEGINNIKDWYAQITVEETKNNSVAYS